MSVAYLLYTAMTQGGFRRYSADFLAGKRPRAAATQHHSIDRWNDHISALQRMETDQYKRQKDRFYEAEHRLGGDFISYLYPMPSTTSGINSRHTPSWPAPRGCYPAVPLIKVTNHTDSARVGCKYCKSGALDFASMDFF